MKLKRLTCEFVINEFANINYIPTLTEYKNAKTYFEVKCDKGHFYQTNMDLFKRGVRCKQCSIEHVTISVTKTQEQFEKEIKIWGNNEYGVIGKYINAFVAVDVKHKVCGTTFPFIPCTMKEKKYCPKCTLKINFEKKLKNKFNGEFELMSEYEDAQISVLFKHIPCGHEFMREPKVLMNKTSSCPRCGGKISGRTTESMKIEISELTNNEYEFRDVFTGTDAKVKMYHKVCGKAWNVNLSSFLHNEARCPKCGTKSKGENKIGDYLDSIEGLEIELQYKFSDCRSKNLLPFDFTIFKDEQLKLIIEYDGKHHFKIIEYFGGENGYKGTKKRDGIKTNYCKAKGIPLLRIPYWEYNNCEYIIENVLGHLGIIYKVKIDSNVVDKYLTNGVDWSMEKYNAMFK